MKVPPNLARARQLVRLIEQELSTLQNNPGTCDPVVPSLAAFIDELKILIDELPPTSDEPASQEVRREMLGMSRRVIAEAAWWFLKQQLFGGGSDD